MIADRKNEARFRSGDSIYYVVDGDVKVSLSTNLYIGDIGVRYEEAPFKLNQFPSEKVADYIRYCITELIDVGQPQKITVFKYSDGSILERINVIKFNNILISFDKPYYYGEGYTGSVDFKTEKYHLVSSFTSNDEEVSIKMSGGEIEINIPRIRWKINDGEWNCKPLSRCLWYEEIDGSSRLCVEIPEGKKCRLLIGNNEVERIDEENNVFNLGKAITKIKNTVSFISTKVCIAFDFKYFDAFDLFFKRRFYTNPVIINSQEKKIIWSPTSYIGKADDSFELSISKDNNIIYKCKLTKEQCGIALNDYDSDIYLLQVYVTISDGEKIADPLFKISFLLGNEKEVKFKNKILSIKHLVLTGNSFVKIRANNLHIDTIKYLGEKDGFDYYSGYIFGFDSNNKKVYLNTMKDHKNIKHQINPVRIELKTSLSCYIGYGLDIEDEDYEYDDEFAVNYKKELVIGIFSDERKTTPIDYYVFDIVPDK